MRKRIVFIKKYLEALSDPETIVFSVDEVGFGKPLRSYGYAKIGEPLLYYHGK